MYRSPARPSKGWEGVSIPAHWPLKVANALPVARRHRRVTPEQIIEFIEGFTGLPSHLQPPRGPAQMAVALFNAQRRIPARKANQNKQSPSEDILLSFTRRDILV